MKSITLFLWFALMVPAHSAEPLAGWGTNLDVARRLARIAEKPVLLYFTATWCGPCKIMAKTTLIDSGVHRNLDSFSRVLLDIDAQAQPAAMYGITAVPTFVLLDSEGDELLRASGYHDTNRFQAWLTAGQHEAAAALARRRLFNEEKQRITAAFGGTNSSAMSEVLPRLFDLVARREQSVVEFASSQIKLAAERQPTLLVAGLQHTNLATRIHLANALRGVWGERFDFDPWETAEVRAAQIEALQSGRDRPSP